VVFGSCARFIGQLATSLIMHEQLFSTSAISGTAAVGGAVTIPFILILGWLADRYSRKLLLAICYAAGIVGFIVLAGSVTLWQYWLSAVFLAILGYGTIGVGAALVSDIVPTVALGRGLAMFNGLTLAGGIVGFAVTGLILEQFGAGVIFGLGILFSLLAGLILIAVRPQTNK
ncbi:MAG: MFS transporter, partial [Chloroflexi bacterium]|nr:MFS transporter [Chloroflexota bacterium]